MMLIVKGKSVAILIVIFCYLPLRGGESFSAGVDLYTDYYRDKISGFNSGSNVQINRFLLELSPSAVITFNDNKSEIVPRIGFIVSSTSQQYGEDEAARVTSHVFAGIGTGTAFFYRFVNRKIFRLSSGIDLGIMYLTDEERFWQLETSFNIPLVIDWIVSRSYFFRFSPHLLSFTFTHSEADAVKENKINVRFETRAGIDFGIYFNLQ